MPSKKIKIDPDFNPGISHPLYLIRSSLYKAFRKHTPELKGRLMDFGCGLKPYEAMFEVDEYIGVDYRGEGPTYSHHKVDVFYDGRTLPFPDDHFDSIFTSEVFEHVFNLPEILKELHRVLRPGGRILASCPFAFGEHEAPADYARYTSFAMRHMFESNGFKVLQLEKTGSFVEAIVQERIAYWDRHIIARISHVPVLRTAVRWIVFGGNNIWAKLWKNILPFTQELYLNNVILAQKNDA